MKGREGKGREGLPPPLCEILNTPLPAAIRFTVAVWISLSFNSTVFNTPERLAAPLKQSVNQLGSNLGTVLQRGYDRLD